MRAWHVAVVASVISLAHVAHAQERITLADGTVMQGELVEKVPNDHITIKLATGEVRTIRWSALAPQMQAPPTPPQVVVQVQGTPQAPPTQGPMTHVAIEADEAGVTLSRVLGYGYVQYGSTTGVMANWQTVCVAPCQADVDTTAMYQITGDGVTPSSTFSMQPPPNGGPLHLRVHAGSLGARVSGAWLLIGGITFALTGSILAVTFAALSSNDSNATGWIVAGLVTTGVGAIMIAVGIPLLIGSGTSVTNDQNVTVAKHHAPIRLLPNGFAF